MVRGLAHAGKRGLSRGAEVCFLEFYDAVGFIIAMWEGVEIAVATTLRRCR